MVVVGCFLPPHSLSRESSVQACDLHGGIGHACDAFGARACGSGLSQSYLSSTRTMLVRDLLGGVRALSDIDGDVPIDGSTLVRLGEVSSGVPKGQD